MMNHRCWKSAKGARGKRPSIQWKNSARKSVTLIHKMNHSLLVVVAVLFHSTVISQLLFRENKTKIAVHLFSFGFVCVCCFFLFCLDLGLVLTIDHINTIRCFFLVYYGRCCCCCVCLCIFFFSPVYFQMQRATTIFR